MNNDHQLFICSNCERELEKWEVFYMYGRVICAFCLDEMGEDFRKMEGWLHPKHPKDQ